MCGRFTVTNADPNVITETFNLSAPPPPDLSARYNVAPTQPVAVVINDAEGHNQLAWMRWGLVPSWSKDSRGAAKMINARAETVAQKPAFRAALSKRRCLIVADGFYEWHVNDDGSKTPMYIQLADHKPFGFAGLWERWTNPEDGEILTTCTLITTTPNTLMESIHNRMPVIMAHDSYGTWLDYKQTDGQKVLPLLTQYPADLMTAYSVSSRVNSSRGDDSSLIQRV
jgi:putative SOS response-associated peptidase YedK